MIYGKDVTWESKREGEMRSDFELASLFRWYVESHNEWEYISLHAKIAHEDGGRWL